MSAAHEGQPPKGTVLTPPLPPLLPDSLKLHEQVADGQSQVTLYVASPQTTWSCTVQLVELPLPPPE